MGLSLWAVTDGGRSAPKATLPRNFANLQHSRAISGPAASSLEARYRCSHTASSIPWDRESNHVTETACSKPSKRAYLRESCAVWRSCRGSQDREEAKPARGTGPLANSTNTRVPPVRFPRTDKYRKIVTIVLVDLQHAGMNKMSGCAATFRQRILAKHVAHSTPTSIN